jgi:hypothetical protein
MRFFQHFIGLRSKALKPRRFRHMLIISRLNLVHLIDRINEDREEAGDSAC